MTLRRSIAFLKNTERAIATVVNVEIEGGDDVYSHTFMFVTAEKKEITYKYPLSSSPASWKVGETAIIAYDSNEPTNAKILTYFGTFSWTIILAAIALPMLTIGVGYHLMKVFLV